MQSNGPSGDYFLGSGGVKRIGRRVKRSKEESAGTWPRRGIVSVYHHIIFHDPVRWLGSVGWLFCSTGCWLGPAVIWGLDWAGIQDGSHT